MARAAGLLAVLLLAACAARPGGALVEPQGFRGIPWGARAGDHADLRQVGEGREERCYVREGERYAVGEVEVQNIYYCFFKDTFYHARVEFAPEEFPGVKYLLYLKYGLPDGADGDQADLQDESVTRYYWEFPGTRLVLSDSGSINYYSKSGTAQWMRSLGVFDEI